MDVSIPENYHTEFIETSQIKTVKKFSRKSLKKLTEEGLKLEQHNSSYDRVFLGKILEEIFGQFGWLNF